MSIDQTALDALRTTIDEEYELGKIEHIEPMPAAHQRRHTKVVVTTPAGRFLAKTYPLDLVVLDALRFQHRLSDHLRKNDLPVALIRAARSGKRVIEREAWALELQDFVEGKPMRIKRDTLAESGATLGRLHRVCHDLPCPPRDASVWRFSEVPRKSFAALFKNAKIELEPDDATDQCNRIARFLFDASQALRLDMRDRFETGLIHGDWHVGNLIFHNGQLAAILDFEFAGHGCYLEDLSYAISNLCIRTSSDENRMRLRCECLLREYQRHRTLSYYEEAALYYAVGVKHIATVSYQIHQMNGRLAGLTPGQWLERLALQSDWLVKRAEEVRAGIH